MFWLGNSQKPQKQVRMANMTIFRNIVFCWLPVSQTRFSQSRLAVVKSFLWGVNEIDCRKAVSHPAPGQIVNFQWRIREGGPGSPLIFRPNWEPNCRKKVFRRPPPPPPYLRDGPLEKRWRVWGIFSFHEFFFSLTACAGIFFQVKPSTRIFFFKQILLFFNTEILIHYLCFCAL